MPERKKFTIILWQPIEKRPENGRYVLLQCIDESGCLVCDYGSYENDRFLYIYDQHTWGEINESCILGWSYFPFDT